MRCPAADGQPNAPSPLAILQRSATVASLSSGDALVPLGEVPLLAGARGSGWWGGEPNPGCRTCGPRESCCYGGGKAPGVAGALAEAGDGRAEVAGWLSGSQSLLPGLQSCG